MLCQCLTKKYSNLRGYSLQATAEKNGLSKNAIYKYNGKKNPSLETLQKIADVLKVSTDTLLTDNPNSSSPPSEIDFYDAINNDQTILTWEGTPISEQDLELIKRLLRKD